MTTDASRKKYNAIAGRKGKAGQWVLTCDKGRFISEGMGLSTLVAAFDDSRIMFAGIRVDGVDVQENVKSVRSKMVRIDWIGSKVAAKHKSKSLVGKQTLSEIMTGCAMNKKYTSHDDLTILDIAETLLNCGGARKPTKYDFGAGEEISLEDVLNHKNPAGSCESKAAPTEAAKPKKKKKKIKYGGKKKAAKPCVFLPD